MHVLKVSTENFMSVGQITIDYEKQGLVLVEGDNQDRDSFESNGAGKSCAFVEALIWCLFDTTIRGTKKDGVVNRTVGKDCRVTVLLDVDGKLVGITRYRNHSEHGNSVRISVDGTDKSASTMRNTEQEIANIVKITPELFYYTCVLGQGMTHRFSELTDAGRKALLETIIRSDIYERARQKAREKQQQLSGAEQFVKGKLDQARVILSQSERAVADEELTRSQQLSKVNIDIEAGITKELDLTKERSAQLIRQGTVEAQIKTQKSICAEAQQQSDAKVAILLKLQRALGSAYSECSGFNKRIDAMTSLAAECPSCFQSVPAQHRASILTSLNDQRNKALIMHNSLEADVKTAQKDVDQLNTTQRAEAQTLNELNSQSGSFITWFCSVDVEIALVKKNVESSRSLKTNLEASSKKSTESLETLRAEISVLDKEHESKRIEAQKYSFWADAFPSIRARMLEKVLTFLNERLAHYLNVLAEGDLSVILEIANDKIVIKSSTKGGDYTSASGGEKRRMDVAMALALNDLAIASTGFSTNFLITDEPADMLDLPGLQRLTSLLKDKAYRVGTVFVITQSQAMKSMIDRHWVVRKLGGVSSLEIA